MRNKDISRRDLLKGAGALVVTFQSFGSVARRAGVKRRHRSIHTATRTTWIRRRWIRGWRSRRTER